MLTRCTLVEAEAEEEAELTTSTSSTSPLPSWKGCTESPAGDLGVPVPPADEVEATPRADTGRLFEPPRFHHLTCCCCCCCCCSAFRTAACVWSDKNAKCLSRSSSHSTAQGNADNGRVGEGEVEEDEEGDDDDEEAEADGEGQRNLLLLLLGDVAVPTTPPSPPQSCSSNSVETCKLTARVRSELEGGEEGVGGVAGEEGRTRVRGVQLLLLLPTGDEGVEELPPGGGATTTRGGNKEHEDEAEDRALPLLSRRRADKSLGERVEEGTRGSSIKERCWSLVSKQCR